MALVPLETGRPPEPPSWVRVVHETPGHSRDHGAMCLVNNTRPVVLDLCSEAGSTLPATRESTTG